jgi:hypothetical protein
MNKLTKNADGGRTGAVHCLQRRLTSLLDPKLLRHLMEVQSLYPRKRPRRPFAIEAAKGHKRTLQSVCRMSDLLPETDPRIRHR